MPNGTTPDERAFCNACGNLVGRVTSRSQEKQRAAIEGAHRGFCKPSAELIDAIRYASADYNDDPDPAALLAGKATAYLAHQGVSPTLFNDDISLSKDSE